MAGEKPGTDMGEIPLLRNLAKRVNIPFDLKGVPQRDIVMGKVKSAETVLTERFPEEFVIVIPYGSRLRGYATESSDTDLAVLCTIRKGKTLSHFYDFFDAERKSSRFPKISKLVNIHPDSIHAAFKSFGKNIYGDDILDITMFLFAGFDQKGRLRKYRQEYIKSFSRTFKAREEQEDAVDRIASGIAGDFDISWDKIVDQSRISPIPGEKRGQKHSFLKQQRFTAWKKRLSFILLEGKFKIRKKNPPLRMSTLLSIFRKNN